MARRWLRAPSSVSERPQTGARLPAGPLTLPGLLNSAENAAAIGIAARHTTVMDPPTRKEAFPGRRQWLFTAGCRWGGLNEDVQLRGWGYRYQIYGDRQHPHPGSASGTSEIVAQESSGATALAPGIRLLSGLE